MDIPGLPQELLKGLTRFAWGNALMVAAGCVLTLLAIAKECEPLLLLPIARGCILATLLGFPLNEAAAIGVIGAIDGPTSIFVATRLAPRLLAPSRWRRTPI